MAYELFLTKSAAKELEKIDEPERGRLRAALDVLSAEPRPKGSRKLQGSEDYRQRVGDYRIVYTVDDNARTVTVSHVAHRREVYR